MKTKSIANNMMDAFIFSDIVTSVSCKKSVCLYRRRPERELPQNAKQLGPKRVKRWYAWMFARRHRTAKILYVKKCICERNRLSSAKMLKSRQQSMGQRNVSTNVYLHPDQMHKFSNFYAIQMGITKHRTIIICVDGSLISFILWLL